MCLNIAEDSYDILKAGLSSAASKAYTSAANEKILQGLGENNKTKAVRAKERKNTAIRDYRRLKIF